MNRSISWIFSHPTSILWLCHLAVLLSLHIYSGTAAKTVEAWQLPLRTKGRWFVDSAGRRVKLACVNW